MPQLAGISPGSSTAIAVQLVMLPAGASDITADTAAARVQELRQGVCLLYMPSSWQCTCFMQQFARLTAFPASVLAKGSCCRASEVAGSCSKLCHQMLKRDAFPRGVCWLTPAGLSVVPLWRWHQAVNVGQPLRAEPPLTLLHAGMIRWYDTPFPEAGFAWPPCVTNTKQAPGDHTSVSRSGLKPPLILLHAAACCCCTRPL